MTWVAAAVAVGSAVVGAYSANKAAKTQAGAARDAASASSEASKYSADLQKQMYDQTRTDQTPWRDAGSNALAKLVSEGNDLTRRFSMADFKADPGYQFRLSEGNQAINRAAAAGGRYDSGATLKALTNYGQNMASQEYGNAYSRFGQDQSKRANYLQSLAGVGQTANNALQNAGNNYASNVGNLMMGNAANQGNAMLAGANARASAYQGIGNSIGNALGQWGAFKGYSAPLSPYAGGTDQWTGNSPYAWD